MCSDCEAYGLKKHGLTRSDCIVYNESFVHLTIPPFHKKFLGIILS